MPEEFLQNILKIQLTAFAVFAVIFCFLYLIGLLKEGKPFSYHGRINRWPFFKKFVFCFFTFIVVAIPTFMLATQVFPPTDLAYAILIAALTAPFYIYFLVLTVKRLHDFNISGKLFLVYVLGLLAFNTIVLFYVGNDPSKMKMLEENTIFSIISTILGITQLSLFILLFFIRGNKRENNYGPDPLAEKIE